MTRERGVTLIEVLIAVTLLSLLTLAMFQAMNIGLNVYAKADTRLMENRRVAGAQRIVQQEIEGMMPAAAVCGGQAGTPGPKILFFQGAAEAMRLVSTFSLQQGWRGQPEILELFVIPGGNGEGVRLVVNETLYTGPRGAGRFCTGPGQFIPVIAGPNSFVLADRLAYCRFLYLQPGLNPQAPPLWTPDWKLEAHPMAVKIEMAPLEPNPGQVQPISVTALIHLHRDPKVFYEDLPY